MSAFVKASAYALTDQPVVNAVIDNKEISYRDYIDISVAVSTPKVLRKTVDYGWFISCVTSFKEV